MFGLLVLFGETSDWFLVQTMMRGKLLGFATLQCIISKEQFTIHSANSFSFKDGADQRFDQLKLQTLYLKYASALWRLWPKVSL